jgi:hypothetical protein
MKKKVLSEIDLYFGQIEMPKDFEIDREKLTCDILLLIFLTERSGMLVL